MGERGNVEAGDAVVWKDSVKQVLQVLQVLRVLKVLKVRGFYRLSEEFDVKSVIIRAGLAVVLALASWLCWREARLVDRAADARMALSLLRYDAVEPAASRWTLSDAVLSDPRSLAADARLAQATAGYWRGRYADAMDIGRQEIDADLLLVAANASFRASQREGIAGQTGVQRLDSVLRAYAAVLKAAPRHPEAAYNYEFVARARDAMARAAAGKAKPEGTTVAPARTETSDLPMGPTLHGRPGAPPPEVKAEDFKIIAPMEFGDREAQPEPTPGAKLPRKG
jgi:hypothetical protein